MPARRSQVLGMPGAQWGYRWEQKKRDGRNQHDEAAGRCVVMFGIESAYVVTADSVPRDLGLHYPPL